MENCTESNSTFSDFSVNPMDMFEILKVVFSVMEEVSSLKSSRQVSTLWNREATRVLFSKGFFRLPQNFHHKYSKEQKQEQIEFIRKFLKAQQLMTAVGKIRIINEEDVEVFQSISPGFLGGGVKSLKLCYGSIDTYNNLVRSLRNLKSLDHEENYPFMTFSAENFKSLISFQKQLTVSHLLFSPVDVFHSKEHVAQNLDMYEKFLLEKMTTRCIQIQLHEALDYNHKSNYVYTDSPTSLIVKQLRKNERLQVISQVTKSLSTLLQTSQSTLEQFVMCNPLGLLRDLKIPRLPQVRSLVVRIRFCDNKYSQKEGIILGLLRDGLLFPPGFKFTDSFPNLKTVQLSAFSVIRGEMKLMELWTRSLSSAGKAEKVKTLVVEDDESGSTKTSLKAIFPNME